MTRDLAVVLPGSPADARPAGLDLSIQASARDDGTCSGSAAAAARTRIGAWADGLPPAEGRTLAALMNDMAAGDDEAYDAALPLVARQLGLPADELDARCRALLRADRALWRGLLLWPLVVGAAALLVAAALALLVAAVR